MPRARVLFLAVFFCPAWAGAQARVTVKARSRRPGEALLVVVEGQPAGLVPTGALDGQALSFASAPSGAYLAVAGIDLETATGTIALALQLPQKDGPAKPWATAIMVRPKRFPVENVRVPEAFVRLSEADEKRAEREAEELKTLFGRATPEALFDGNFASPIAGAKHSNFGARRVFNGVPKSPHTGADLHARTGTPVRASASGTVVMVKNLFYSGNSVFIDHGLGLYTGYFHLSSFDVKEGQKVKRGDVVGKSGMTGRASKPHLHWAARWGRARVDPYSLVSLDVEPWLRPSK